MTNSASWRVRVMTIPFNRLVRQLVRLMGLLGPNAGIRRWVLGGFYHNRLNNWSVRIPKKQRRPKRTPDQRRWAIQRIYRVAQADRRMLTHIGLSPTL